MYAMTSTVVNSTGIEASAWAIKHIANEMFNVITYPCPKII